MEDEALRVDVEATGDVVEEVAEAALLAQRYNSSRASGSKSGAY